MAGPEGVAARPAAEATPTRQYINARYQLINQLARGGMGSVYRAIDRLSGRVVTVKRLRMTASTEAQGSTGLRWTLAHEFRLLASLQHPNVISVLDYGFGDDDEPFLAMDLEENALTIVEAGAELPLAMQVDLLVQTLRALVYLHRLGIIHRDLKPENILVVRGQVKVLDFGLSTTRELASAEVGWAGTPAYMAPETLMGEPPSAQSDLYGLGMVAYELLTGAHPFANLDAQELFHAIGLVTLPRSNDEIDARLLPVLTRLLAKKPVARYAEAREVIEDLGAALGRPITAETVATRESTLQTAPLVGRADEIAALEAALREAIRGNGSTWLVGGESGVGKSRVLDELRTRALVEGAVVVRGQAVGQGGSPYHPWRDVVSNLLLRVEVSDPDAEVLATIVPNVAELLGRDVGLPPPLDSEAAQTRLLFAVEEVLRLQSRPVVVILEDLQWAGSESQKLLAWLVQTTERLQLLLVGSFRDDEAPELPAAIPGAHVIALRRLHRDEIALLGETMIGPAANRADVLDLLERETEGIPFFVVEVVRTLAESAGALNRVGTDRLPTRVVSGRMEKVVRRRLARVDPDALPALRTAAVVGRRINPELLRAVHPDLDVDEWTAVCARAAALELRDQHWMFAHDKLRERLLEDLPAAARRAMHRTIGEAMERLYHDRGDHLAALAHHWRETGEVQREAGYARGAGMVALQTGACQEAVAFLCRARELLAVADGSSVARRRRRALIDPNAAVDPAGPEFVVGQVEGALSEAFYRLGDLRACREHSVRALANFGQHVPSGAAGWTWGLLCQGMQRSAQTLTRFRARDVERARRVATEVARVQLRLTDTFFYSLRLRPIVWSSVRVVNQCAPAGRLPELAQGYVILARLAGAARARRLAETWGRRALAIAEDAGIERNVAWIRTRLAGYHIGECHWSDAEAHLGQAAAVAERVGDLRLWEEARVQHALLKAYSGRFEQSVPLLRDAHRLCRRTGNRQIECWALMAEGGVVNRLGQHAEAVRLVEAALQMIDEDVMKAEAICAYGVLAPARLLTPDLPGAYEAADRALWHIRAMKPVAFWTQPAIAGTAEVLLALLEADWAPAPTSHASVAVRADQAVAALRRFARHFPLGRPYATVWTGLAAWIAGRRRRAFRLWKRAIVLSDQLGTPYERARAHLEIGRHLVVEDTERRPHLHQAEEIFQRLGCAADLVRVRNEIARERSAAAERPGACP